MTSTPTPWWKTRPIACMVLSAISIRPERAAEGPSGALHAAHAEQGIAVKVPPLEPAIWEPPVFAQWLKKHRPDVVVTVNDFYAKQHPDGFICRQIREANGTECFQRFDPAGTEPNVFAWVEWEYFRTVDDTARLARVFPALFGLHQWFRRYRAVSSRRYSNETSTVSCSS